MRMPTRRGLLALVIGGVLLLPTLARSAGDRTEILATGGVDPRLAGFDRLMIDFIRRQDVPGGSLTVARNGHIVYSRGFGLADRERQELVQPDSLFRIASISKPITAVAVLQLAERGKLRLDDKVFDVLGLKAEPDDSFDERWRRVTLRHCLQHRGGWDRARSGDPLFRSPRIVRSLGIEPPARPDDIIRFMLRQPFDFEPGARYAYSNFGFCLLGRVIEKVTGRKYEDYVRAEVLAPLGVRSMRLGRTLLEDRLPGEVRYYAAGKSPGVLPALLGRQVDPPYGSWSQESLDSIGGWVASAPDLVRFASAFIDPRRCPVLKEESIAEMLARPEGEGGSKPDDKAARRWYYACGWMVRPLDARRLTVYHTGSLSGTSTLLVRRADGLVWAALFNSRGSGKGAEPAGAIDPMLHRIADEVKEWPGG
jgi:N-acyl-D-amino-acid deacylase